MLTPIVIYRYILSLINQHITTHVSFSSWETEDIADLVFYICYQMLFIVLLFLLSCDNQTAWTVCCNPQIGFPRSYGNTPAGELKCAASKRFRQE